MTDPAQSSDESAATQDLKPCFFIAPIGPVQSDVRKRSNQVLKYIVRPVLQKYGYKAVRGDEMDQGGLITSHILNRISSDPLVIADLTDANPNVYYELAVRHVLRKPFIQLIDSEQRLPFDVAGLRTITLNHRDLDSVEEAKGALGRAIESVERGEPFETPMSYAIELQDLRSSNNPEDQGMAQILEMVTRLQHEVRGVRSRGAPVEDFMALRRFVELLSRETRLLASDVPELISPNTSKAHKEWAQRLDYYKPVSSFDDEPPF
jgi:hypothetical protein